MLLYQLKSHVTFHIKYYYLFHQQAFVSLNWIVSANEKFLKVDSVPSH